jgi:hypothetical protein
MQAANAAGEIDKRGCGPAFHFGDPRGVYDALADQSLSD